MPFDGLNPIVGIWRAFGAGSMDRQQTFLYYNQNPKQLARLRLLFKRKQITHTHFEYIEPITEGLTLLLRVENWLFYAISR